MIAPAIEVEHAYRACERITRREAANFFYGIRLLPRAKREAMSAVYAFARRVDDIGDGELPAAEKLARLAAERARLAALSEPKASGPLDPVTVALAHAGRRFELPLDALEELIEGVRLDIEGTRYATFEELVGYCRCVAGSIGRLCLAIFLEPGAAGREQGAPLADELGVAMQLTNILRDIREDAERGRLYLPAGDLARFGCPADGVDLLTCPGAGELVRFEAARARERFAHGLTLVALLDARSASCVLAMTGIYRHILERIERDPAAVMRGRVSLSTGEKSWIAARSLLRGRTAGGSG